MRRSPAGHGRDSKRNTAPASSDREEPVQSARHPTTRGANQASTSSEENPRECSTTQASRRKARSHKRQRISYRSTPNTPWTYWSSQCRAERPHDPRTPQGSFADRFYHGPWETSSHPSPTVSRRIGNNCVDASALYARTRLRSQGWGGGGGWGELLGNARRTW